MKKNARIEDPRSNVEECGWREPAQSPSGGNPVVPRVEGAETCGRTENVPDLFHFVAEVAKSEESVGKHAEDAKLHSKPLRNDISDK